ncbi:MAG: FmdE family protein [Spirochaetota bacterium]
METDYLNYDACLETARQFHGEVCGGIMIGTRMSIVGMKSVGILDPKGKDRKNLMIFVEIDRCATDAILAVTGCHPGKRTMKIMDYGKMAATFINLKTGKAVRVAAKNRDGDKVITREMMEKNPHTPDYYSVKTDEELFDVHEVSVTLKPEDLPGRPVRSVVCSSCGERVMDAKELVKDDKTICRTCAGTTTYYSKTGK